MDEQKRGPNRERTVRETLNEVLAKLPADTVRLETVLDLIGQEGLLLFCVFLTLPFMVPVSIPGVSTAFGAVTLLIGLSVFLNRRPWLPERFMKRGIPAVKLHAALDQGIVWLQRLERISRPRLLGLTHGATMRRLNGLMLMYGAFLLMAPFGLVPLSNTLPGLALLFLAVGMLQRDGGCVLLGYFLNLLTTIYFVILLVAGTAVLRALAQAIVRWFG
jgi:hypothetical protein